MNSIIIGLVSAASIFVGALVGMWLQRRLPVDDLSNKMQNLVNLSAGTVATLTALVLGLLVSSAKSSFDTINNGIVQGSAKFILLDRTLARYGPETKATREQLKNAIATGIKYIWPNEKTGVTALTAFERANGMELVQNKLDELTPKTDLQRQILSQAQQMVSDLSQTRWLLLEEAQTQLPVPLLVILICWLVLLFVSFGLFAPRNSMAVMVLLVGACSLSAAISLVIEMNQPLEGFIKVSSAPLLNALQHIGQ